MTCSQKLIGNVTGNKYSKAFSCLLIFFDLGYNKCFLQFLKLLFMGKLRFLLLFAASVLWLSVDAQTKRITGTVLSSDGGTALQGVSVTIKGAKKGAMTDTKGKFSINAATGETLVISSVGFEEKQLVVGNEDQLTIQLKPSAESMQTVMVIGYGTARKKQVVGSASVVSAKDAGATTVTNPSQLLIGKAAGVQVVNSSGVPGSGSQIIVRGTGSFTSVDPLYVIDGIQTGAGTFSAIAPQDIESITVLKDASSTAIYGTAAANGVVIVTTKKIRSGAPRISVTSQISTSQPWKKLDLLKARDYVELMKDYAAAKGVPVPAKLNSPDVLVDRNDWQNEIFRHALSTENDVNVSGGSDKVLYNLSLGYISQQAIVKNYEYKRLNARFSLDETFGRFHFGQNITMRYSKNTGQVLNLFFDGVTTYPTYQPIYDTSILGGYSIVSNLNDLASARNPFQALNTLNRKGDDYILYPQFFAEVNILKGLTLRSQVAATYASSSGNSFSKEYTAANFINKTRSASLSLSNSFYYTLENYLTYNKRFDKHNVSVTAGTSYIDDGYSRSLSETGTNIANDNIQNTNVALNKTVTSSEGYGATRTKSYFGRLIYTFNDKYIVSASMRRDGSANFGPNSRYGNFPGLGLAWNFSDENFIRNSLSFISDGKLRLGWGRTGNNKFPMGRTDAYTWSGTPGGSLVYSFGPSEGYVSGTTVALIPNPALRWEETEQTDAGIDLGFLSNRINLTVDVYNRRSSGLIVSVPLPASTGIMGVARLGNPSIITNAADAQNKGVEIALGYRSVPKNNFSYNVNANFSYNKNTTLSLGTNNQVPIRDGGLAQSGSITYTYQGSPIGAYYGYRVDHVAKDQAEIDALNAKAAVKTGNVSTKYQSGLLPGDFIYKDLNGDGVMDSKDQEILGSPVPKYMYGFNAGASYKNFDLNVVISGLAGVNVVNGTKYYTESVIESHNTTTALLNRWRNPGDVALLPRVGQSIANLRPSDWYVENGAYMRLRNLTVGYSIPAQTLKNFSHNVISGLRVYVAAQNLLTLTDYSGYDPEVQNGDGFIFTRGIDGGQLPQPRTFIAGVQFQF
jgi:TonB-dependent starch-binding outer membrane protein SusC